MQISRLVSSVAFRTAVIMCAVFFAAGLSIAVIGPSLPVLAQHLQVDVALLGGLITAFSTGVLVAQPGVVWVLRHFDRRTALVASMVLMSIGSMMVAQGAYLVLMFIGAWLAGFGYGGVLATGNTLVAQLFPTGSTAALNSINLFFGVGSVVGPALAAAANARLGAPQIALWIGAVALLLLVPVVLGLAAKSANGTISASAAANAAPVRAWLLGLLLLLYIGSEIAFSSWLTRYMERSAGMDMTNAALMVSVFWLALTGGRAFAVLLGLRFPAQVLLRLCLVGLLLGALVLALSIGNISLTCAAVLLFGLSCGPMFPTILALATSSANSTRVTGMVLTLGNIGGMLLPALLGFLLERYGPVAVVGQVLVEALLMIVLGMLAFRPHPVVVPALLNQRPPNS